VKTAFGLGDRLLVDSGDPALHQSLAVELSVLVAVGAEPLTAVVMVFMGEAHGDTVAGMGPDFLDQPIVELARKRRGSSPRYVLDCFAL
jgi:hypothetical protein